MKRGHFELPQSVIDAGATYRDGMDSVRGFLNDRCILGAGHKTRRKALYDAYVLWCGENGLHPLAAPRLYKRLRADHHLVDGVVNGQRDFRGVGLRRDEEPDDGWGPITRLK
jgi:putative DNA primase/helicase